MRALVAILLCAAALTVAARAADDGGPAVLGISLSTIETSAGKAAFGGAVNLIPKQSSPFSLFGENFTVTRLPRIEVSGAGGDAFSHVRLQEVLTRYVDPEKTFDVFAQGYVGYDADTDFRDASAYWGVGLVPYYRFDTIENRVFAYDANSAGLFFEMGTKISDPTPFATGGKIDRSGDVEGDTFYRLKANFNCVVDLTFRETQPCSLDPALRDVTLSFFFQLKASAYYNIRPGLFAPEVEGQFAYRFGWCRTTLYLGAQYGSGAPTFNRDTQFKFNVTSDLFNLSNLMALGCHDD